MKLRALVAIERRDLADIGAADKGTLTGAGQDHEPQLRVRGKRAGGFDDLPHQAPVEAVQLGGVVDRQPRETAALGPLLMLEPKHSSSCPAARRVIAAAAAKTKQERMFPAGGFAAGHA